MKKSYIVPAFMVVSTALFGCSNSSTSEVAKPNSANQMTVSNSVVNQTTANTNPAAANLSNTAAAGGSNSLTTGANTAGNTSSPTANKDVKSSPASQPVAQIGSGAGDLVLFTQVRSALSADQELAKNVIIEIKEGNVVLTGSVSSEAQKSKATQLARSINGIKSVKNNLRAAS